MLCPFHTNSFGVFFLPGTRGEILECAVLPSVSVHKTSIRLPMEANCDHVDFFGFLFARLVGLGSSALSGLAQNIVFSCVTMGVWERAMLLESAQRAHSKCDRGMLLVRRGLTITNLN